MSLKNLRELAVLAAVRSHPAHGYAIAESLSSSIGWSIGMTRSTVYAVLKRFEQRGWIEGRHVQDTKFPERVEYVVTEDGASAYPELLSETANSEVEAVMPLAVVLMHLDDLPEKEQRDVLSKIRERREVILTGVESLPQHGGSIGLSMSLMTTQLRHDIEHIDTALAAIGKDVQGIK